MGRKNVGGTLVLHFCKNVYIIFVSTFFFCFSVFALWVLFVFLFFLECFCPQELEKLGVRGGSGKPARDLAPGSGRFHIKVPDTVHRLEVPDKNRSNIEVPQRLEGSRKRVSHKVSKVPTLEVQRFQKKFHITGSSPAFKTIKSPCRKTALIFVVPDMLVRGFPGRWMKKGGLLYAMP